jgi:amino acid transporter
LDDRATNTQSNKRFGTFSGVFTPSILTILGVIMYLRFGWVVGNAGLLGALLIVVVAHLITITTGLSISSIATNRTVGAGGAYNIISRSLGAPAGAAIGLPLFFGQALSVSFYVVGFTESLAELVPSVPARAIGTGVLVLLTLVSFKSATLAIKTQYLVMGAIGLSLISFFAGRAADPPQSVAWSAPEGAAPFAQVFAVFFPAVTGIMAGVGMSGDLKDPRRSLPRGTMAAILTGFAIYLAMPIWLALNASSQQLLENKRVVWEISGIPPLIYAGVWGATLSSAVGSILTAPRTLQALSLDGLAPGMLGRGSGPHREPRIGLLVTFAMAQVGILFGNLDLIANLLTMFFLATYGLTNLACGLERWAASPSFRPEFKVPWWVSLLGGIACFYVMSIIDLVAMVAALLICAGIFIYAERRALDTTFGDARHGIWSALVRTALHQLRRTGFHPQNWRPNLLIMGGGVEKRPHLLDLGSAIVQDRGIVTYFHLLKGSVEESAEARRELSREIGDKVSVEHPQVFVRVDVVGEIYKGALSVAQSYGVGPFEANTVMLGWPQKQERSEAYITLLQDLAGLDRSLLLVRHKPELGFGLKRKIQIWWGGLQGNGGLLLLLAYLLTAHHDWRHAEVSVVIVVGSEEVRATAEAGIRRILASARLRATPRVIVREGRSIEQIMRSESVGVDLAIIGIRLPVRGEPEEAFFDRMNSLLAELPTTVLVHSARTFEGAPVLFERPVPSGDGPG